MELVIFCRIVIVSCASIHDHSHWKECQRQGNAHLRPKGPRTVRKMNVAQENQLEWRDPEVNLLGFSMISLVLSQYLVMLSAFFIYFDKNCRASLRERKSSFVINCVK